MKILVFSDIHGDAAALQTLMATEADYYFAAGDLVNWARGLDAMGEIMKPKAGRVYVMPGNHESEADIKAFCEKFGFHNFHGAQLDLGIVTVCGLGYSNPTPFDTPGEYSETELRNRLAIFSGIQPMILICHCPPKDTLLDRAGEGKHFGSEAVGEFIQSAQPLWFFCGHIHEAAGIMERLGPTTGMNVGKKGYLLDVTELAGDPSHALDLVEVARGIGSGSISSVILQGVLESAGIPSVVTGDGEIHSLRYSLRVPANREAEARAALDEARAAGPAAADAAAEESIHQGEAAAGQE